MGGFILGTFCGLVAGIIFGPMIWSWFKGTVEKNHNQNPKP